MSDVEVMQNYSDQITFFFNPMEYIADYKNYQ